MSSPSEASFLDRGIYDANEVARLVRVHPEKLARWTTGGSPLVRPSFEQRLFDFEDLVSLLIIAELRRRHVELDEIRVGIEVLRDKLEVERPLAHIDARRRLATVGRSLFAHFDEWADAGKRLQLAFQPVIEPVLKPIEYDTQGMAELWRPLRLVTATRHVQAGTPCIEATRVPTTTIADLVAVDEDPEDVAFDLDLEIEQVQAAVRFEAALNEPFTASKALR